MDLYFGIVQEYNIERGFGFLIHPTYLGPSKKVFFHISNVKKSNDDLAKRLSNFNANDEIGFWYTTEITDKGEKLQWIINPIDVFKSYQKYLPNAVEKIDIIWVNSETVFPFWLSDVTIGLFGINLIQKLENIREVLIQKTKEEWESKLKQDANLKIFFEEKDEIEYQKLITQQKYDALCLKRIEKIEERLRLKQEKKDAESAIAKLKETENNEFNLKEDDKAINEETKLAEETKSKMMDEQKLIAQNQIKLEYKNHKNMNINFDDTGRYEFELLVAEVQAKGFTRSSEVSNYIVKNRLGDKYQNISGILEMQNSHSTWKFNGGFPPVIYRMLCERLNLGNNETDSKVVGFTSFKVLNKNNE